MPGGAEGSYCSANEPASITGHGSASQQSDSVVNALKVMLLRYSPCKMSCLLLNMCCNVLATFLWTPLGCYCHEQDCCSVCHSLRLWTVCFSGQGSGPHNGGDASCSCSPNYLRLYSFSVKLKVVFV